MSGVECFRPPESGNGLCMLTALINRTTYNDTCPVCKGSGNQAFGKWDPVQRKNLWNKCVNCRGYGLMLRNDLYERAVSWDLWLNEHPNVATRFLSWCIRPLCRVAVRRWNI